LRTESDYHRNVAPSRDEILSIDSNTVIRSSVCLSVTLCIGLNGTSIQQKCLNKRIGSAPLGTRFLQLSTPTLTLGVQKRRRVIIVWKSCIRTNKHQKQTSVWNCK